MGHVVVQIIGLASGVPSPFDGQFLVEYDPTRPGRTPAGRPLTAHIVCTANPAQAQRFPSAVAAWETIKRESGLPHPANRPLTAFTLLLDPVS